MKEKDPILHPKLDPKNLPHEKAFEILIQRFQKVQSFCLQAGTCTSVGDGNPGLDCARKDGQSDRRCFIYNSNLGCPLNRGEPIREKSLKEIKEKLDPWWVNLYHKLLP